MAPRSDSQFTTDTDTPSDVLAAAFVANDLSQLGMNITVVNETRSQIVSAYDDTNVQNGVIVMSSSTPVFGIAPIDIRPGFQVYFPWHAAPTNWLLPFSAETQFEQESVIVNSSTDLSVVQKAVQQIDLINSQYLPVIVLAYPDEPVGVQILVQFQGYFQLVLILEEIPWIPTLSVCFLYVMEMYLAQSLRLLFPRQ